MTMQSITENTETIDQDNKSFWDEMCGTTLARQIGVTDFSDASLNKFDRHYFDYYPYLKKYFNLLSLHNKNVLEIGLGYGTTSSYLASMSSDYHAVDIAQGPIDLVNKRLSYLNKPPQAKIQSCHALDFPDNYFDNVISIGCFHHTGSIQKCMDEAYRVLKPGGKLLFMCYNKHSLRMLRSAPFSVFLNPKNPIILNSKLAFLFDSNTKLEAAPFVELGSMSYYRKTCSKFSKVELAYENCDIRWRKYILNNISRVIGFNVFGVCTK